MVVSRGERGITGIKLVDFVIFTYFENPFNAAVDVNYHYCAIFQVQSVSGENRMIAGSLCILGPRQAS